MAAQMIHALTQGGLGWALTQSRVCYRGVVFSSTFDIKMYHASSTNPTMKKQFFSTNPK
jgi:hypothetical protein